MIRPSTGAVYFPVDGFLVYEERLMSEPESLNTMFQNSFVKVADGKYALTTLGGPVVDNSVGTAAIVDGAVTSAKIADGTIVDADIAAAANIAGSKLANAGVVLSKLGADVTPKLITKQAAQSNSTAVDVPGVVTDINAILAKLRLAGVIA
jgi:hypothetical protein